MDKQGAAKQMLEEEHSIMSNIYGWKFVSRKASHM